MQTRCTWYRSSPTGDQMYVHQEFQDQLKRKADGSYETSLLWKPGHPPLHNDKNGSLSRLSNLIRKLRKQPIEFEQYNQIIQTQLSEGIIEKAHKEVKGTELYIPINQLWERSSKYQNEDRLWRIRTINTFKSFIKWMPRNGTITSELVVKCSYPKSLFTSSALRGYQTSLPTSAYQGRWSRSIRPLIILYDGERQKNENEARLVTT